MAKKLGTAAMLAAAVAAGYLGGLMSHSTQKASAGTSPSIAEELRARSFVLVDATGRTRGKLASFGGQPGLSLLDSAGRPRGMFTTVNDEPRLILYDPAGKSTWAAP